MDTIGSPAASSCDSGSDSDGFLHVSSREDYVMVQSPKRSRAEAGEAPAAASSAGADGAGPAGPTVGTGGGVGTASHNSDHQPATSISRPSAFARKLASSIDRSHAAATEAATTAAKAATANITGPASPLGPYHPPLHQHQQQKRPPRTKVAAVSPEAPRLPSHYVERSALLEKVVNELIGKKHLDNRHARNSSTTKIGDSQLHNNSTIDNNGGNANTSGDGNGNENSNNDDGREGAAYALLGDSGSGKTVLASAIVSHPEVRKKFWRGIFWVSLGRAGVARATAGTGGDLLRAVFHALAAQVVAIANPLPANSDEAAAATALLARSASPGETLKKLTSSNGSSRLGRQNRLLVLDGISESFTDNVNTVAELQRAGFVVLVTGAKPCALSLLQSKRTSSPAEPEAGWDLGNGRSTPQHCLFHISVLQAVTSNEAVEMLLKRVRRPGGAAMEVEATTLAGWAEQKAGDAGDPGVDAATRASFESCALQVVNDCGEIAPLALAIVGAVVAGQDERGGRRDNSPPCDYAERCCQIERQVTRHQDCGDGYDMFSSVMELGFGALAGDNTKDCFVRLGVLAEGTVAPLDMLSNLWEQHSERDIARTVNELLKKSFLIEMHPGSRCYSIHDRVLAFAKTKLLRAGSRPDGVGCRCYLGVDNAAAPTTARSTREAAVANQVGYLSRSSTLSRFSYSGGGSNGVIGGEAGAARGCGGDGMMLGGLQALAALWQSLEDLRSGDGCYCGHQISASNDAAPRLRPFVRDAYGASLQDTFACVPAAFGHWAAAKLLQLQGFLEDAKTMARKSVRMGHALYHADAAQAERLFSESALLRVQKGKDDELVDRYKKGLESVKLSYGCRHPAVASALNSLARVELEQHKPILAGVCYREAVRVLDVSLGDDHPMVAKVLIDAAEAEMKQFVSLPHEKEKRLLLRAHVGELCSRALSIYDNDLGTTGIVDPCEKATSFVRLAHMLEEQDNVEEAERLCRAALHTLEEESTLGPDHVHVAATLVSLADLLGRKEKPQVPPLHKIRRDEATELLRRAVGIGESWFRNDLAHEKLALWRNKLARAFTSVGKHIEAASQYLKVIERCKEEPSIDQKTIVDLAHGGLNTLANTADFNEIMTRFMIYSSGDRQTRASDDNAQTATLAATAATTPPYPPMSAAAPGVFGATNEAPVCANNNTAQTATSAATAETTPPCPHMSTAAPGVVGAIDEAPGVAATAGATGPTTPGASTSTMGGGREAAEPLSHGQGREDDQPGESVQGGRGEREKEEDESGGEWEDDPDGEGEHVERREDNRKHEDNCGDKNGWRGDNNNDDEQKSLEAAVFYLYANNPRNRFADEIQIPLDEDEKEIMDLGLQEALSLSIRDMS
ncbi:unnamed protein product [Ectocarpus sp. 12 AP-2014]